MRMVVNIATGRPVMLKKYKMLFLFNYIGLFVFFEDMQNVIVNKRNKGDYCVILVVCVRISILHINYKSNSAQRCFCHYQIRYNPCLIWL